MSDFKSKLPNLKELGDIASKLFGDLKTSVSEIITEYKKNHPDTPGTEQEAAKSSEEEKPAAEKKKAKEKDDSETPPDAKS